MQINCVIISGNLVGDPEARSTENGQPVANFILANNRSFKASDGSKKDEVAYIKVVVFGKQADACIQHLKKGAAVIVEGHLAQDRWEDKDGKQHTKTKVVAKSVNFVFAKREDV